MLSELAQFKLFYLCLSALSFTGVSFLHPHSNKCVIVNFPFLPDSEKRGHFFVLSYWTEKDETSGRKPRIPLYHVQFKCIYLISVVSGFPLPTANTLEAVYIVTHVAIQETSRAFFL